MTRPMVQVVQQIASTSTTSATPDLNTVLVGPAYNVQTYADNKSDILVGVYGEDDTASMVAPIVSPLAVTVADTARGNHVTGAILDDASVAVYLDDCYVIVDGNAAPYSSGTATVASGTPYLITVSSGLETTALTTNGYLIQPGDRLVITESGGEDAVRTVRTVASATTFTVTEELPAAFIETGMSWRVEHKLDDVLTSAFSISADDTITVSTGQTASYLGSSRTVAVANVYVAYRELRQDLGADVSTYSSLSSALAAVGVADDDNPLGLAAQLYFANSTAPLRLLAVNSDDTAGHAEAISVLEARNDVYFIGVLSSSSSILAQYKAHVEAMSLPGVSQFRVAAGGGVLTTSITVASGTPSLTNTSADFTDSSATFISDGVTIGDTVTLAGTSADDGDYTVAAILSETRITLSDTMSTTESTGTYTITRTLDKQAQVDYLEATPASFDSKRMILVWPSSITVGGVAGLSGHYMVAVLGGMVSSLPSHQPFTNVGVAGVDTIAYSNFYFTNAQIDELSAAGWYVFIQDTTTSLPYCVHQVTTAQSGLTEEVEFSVVKNFDYISQDLIDALDGFVGRWTINEQNLGFIRSAINNRLDLHKSVAFPRIGARLNAGSVDSIAINSNSSTTVDVYISITLPKPLNTLVLYLTSE